MSVCCAEGAIPDVVQCLVFMLQMAESLRLVDLVGSLWRLVRAMSLKV